MIPLIRPLVPPPPEWLPQYEASARAGVFSNFGPCFDRAVAMLSAHSPTLPVANGTVALEVILQASLWPGARVAVPDFTFTASVSAIRRVGMVPVIAPVDRKTWALSLDALAAHLEDFDAILVVSPFGYHVDVPAYDRFGDDHQKGVLYDFAGGWGMPFHTLNPVAFSFHATKNLGIGEGGAAQFWWSHEFAKAKSLINFSFDETRFPWASDAMNGKLDELHCAILCAHLGNVKRIADRIAVKRARHLHYADRLPNFEFSPKAQAGSPYTVVMGGVRNPEQVVSAGLTAGITFRRSYWPLMSDAFPELPRIGVADPFFRSCVALPSDLDDNEFEQVVAFLKSTALPL